MDINGSIILSNDTLTFQGSPDLSQFSVLNYQMLPRDAGTRMEVSFTLRRIFLNGASPQPYIDHHAGHVHNVSKYLCSCDFNSISETSWLLAFLLPFDAIYHIHDRNLLAAAEQSPFEQVHKKIMLGWWWGDS